VTFKVVFTATAVKPCLCNGREISRPLHKQGFSAVAAKTTLKVTQGHLSTTALFYYISFIMAHIQTVSLSCTVYEVL